jgi:Na+/pantothenate symporter
METTIAQLSSPNQARAKEANRAEAKLAETSTNFIAWLGIKITLLCRSTKMPLIIWLWFVALRESQPTEFVLSILTVEEEKANTIIVRKSIFVPLIFAYMHQTPHGNASGPRQYRAKHIQHIQKRSKPDHT